MGDQHCKIRFPTPEGPFGGESMWAIRTGARLARVDNIPFFTYDANCGDTIRWAPDDDGVATFERVVKRGPNHTFRALATYEGADLTTLAAELRALVGDDETVGIEGGFESVLALSLPIERASAAIAALAVMEADGRITGWEGPILAA